MDLALAILITVVGASTPLLIAAPGEMAGERARGLTPGAPYLALLAGAFAGTAASLIFGFLTLSLTANQTATGLALTIFGPGFSALAGSSYSARPVTLMQPLFPADISAHPIARVVFGYSFPIYFAFIMVVAIWYFLHK